MCGIAGIVSLSSSDIIKEWLYNASELLKHRGNDDDGIVVFDKNSFYCSKIEHELSSDNHLPYLQYTHLQNIPNQYLNVGLLHRRLSIIDLSEYGHQPMCDESGKVWITYNGEVYNYIELRQMLESKGVKFFSNTDTEVILKAYLHFGKTFVHHLSGMWALAIYDTRSGELILSRDRIGVKPLYYYHSKNIFAFASEQKVFLKTHLVPFEINTQALAKYFIDNVLEHQPEGIFKSIFEVQPGENIIVRTSDLSVQKEKFFQLHQLTSTNIIENENEVIQGTKNILENTIHTHLRSDVEVAVSLSGGIDSSVIAVGAAKYLKHLHTFSIVFPQQKNLDESIFVNAVNSSISAHSHYITPTAEMFFNDIDELLYSQDIPIWSTSTYNQFLLMREVKNNNIKVILSGQGSDELFAGYQHHYVAYWLQLMKELKIISLVKHLHVSQPYHSQALLLLIKSVIKNFYSHKYHVISKYLSKDVLKKYDDINEHYINNDLNTELIKDLSYRRLKAFLKCEDRCSMWHGVESRLPFSDDINLLQWAFQIPAYLKLKNGVSKYVLREAFKQELPESIYLRKDKKAFDAPLKEWMILKKQEILSEIKNHSTDIINIKNISKINDFRELSKTETELIFKLYLFSRWRKLW